MSAGRESVPRNIQFVVNLDSPETENEDIPLECVPVTLMNMTGSKKNEHHRETFFNFFVVRDGIISFSLRDFTMTCNLVISVSFLAMLYQACSEEQLQCNFELDNLNIPMISDVVALPIFDRVFILLNTIYFMGVHQVNIRAFYKRLNDAGVSELHNDLLFYAGMASCFSLPLIGVFDCNNFPLLHYMFAGTFFLAAGLYTYFVANLMYKQKEKFPVSD
jgi:hypothetical protein